MNKEFLQSSKQVLIAHTKIMRLHVVCQLLQGMQSLLS